MPKVWVTPIHSPKHEGVLIAYLHCPGCNGTHGPNVGQANEYFPVVWAFNGDVEKPTFSPSLLVQSDGNVCHSFVRDGKIEFLSDCTHALAGQTVDLPEWT